MIWCLTIINDIEAIERTKRKATKNAHGLRNHSCKESLRILLRLKRDLIQIFIMIVCVEWVNKIRLKHKDVTGPITRGHRLHVLRIIIG